MEKTKQKLPGQALYKIGHKTETHANVSLALATRRRIRDFTNLSSLEYELRHAGFKIVHDDFMDYWQEWQTAGLGTLALARNKKKCRFLHFYDMKKVAEAMLDGKDVEVDARKQESIAASSQLRAEQLDDVARSIAKASVASNTHPPSVKTAVRHKKVERKPATSAAKALFNRVLVSLRPGVMLDLSIPADITTAELDTLKDAIGRLIPTHKVA